MILTSNSSDLSDDDIKNSITTVESIVSTEELDQNVIWQIGSENFFLELFHDKNHTTLSLLKYLFNKKIKHQIKIVF